MLSKAKIDEIKIIMNEIKYQEDRRIKALPPKYTKQQLIEKIEEMPTEIFKTSEQINQFFVIPEKYINNYHINFQAKKDTLKTKYLKRLLTINENQIEAFLDNYEKGLKQIGRQFLENNPYYKIEE